MKLQMIWILRANPLGFGIVPDCPSSAKEPEATSIEAPDFHESVFAGGHRSKADRSTLGDSRSRRSRFQKLFVKELRVLQKVVEFSYIREVSNLVSAVFVQNIGIRQVF